MPIPTVSAFLIIAALAFAQENRQRAPVQFGNQPLTLDLLDRRLHQPQRKRKQKSENHAGYDERNVQSIEQAAQEADEGANDNASDHVLTIKLFREVEPEGT